MSVDTECFEQITLFLKAHSLPKIGTFRYENNALCDPKYPNTAVLSTHSPTCDAFAVIFRIDRKTNELVPEGYTVR